MPIALVLVIMIIRSEAVAFAEEVAKLHSAGNTDVEQMATGLEAVTSVRGSSSFDLSQVTDMMNRASTILDVGIQDLMDMMRQTLPMVGNLMERLHKRMH